MKKHILLDIEALGLRPGSAIFELAAVEFFPETGWVGTGFEAMIEPQAPFTADLETLAWHSKKGTWPRPFAEDSHSIGAALAEFGEWVRGLGEVEAFWAWGATYDFPLLTAAYDFTGFPTPWRYYECRCARTVWQTAFGDRKHGPRPHRAIDDAKAAAVDLMAAMDALRMPEAPEESLWQQIKAFPELKSALDELGVKWETLVARIQAAAGKGAA